MKILRKLLMKRRRRSSDDIVYGLDGSAAAAAKKEKDVPFWRRRRSESALTLEETEGSFADDSSPWRAENILINGSFRESDWWEEVDVDHVEATAATTSSEELQVRVATAPKKFRNRGLETWLQVRQAWKESGQQETDASEATSPARTLTSSGSSSGEDCAEDQSSTSPAAGSSSSSSSQAIKEPSPALRREIIKNLSNNRRQYALPKRMTLSSMIGVYEEMWNGSD